jgi:uncharacterized protein YqjF (DUF2071 family)
MTQTWHNLLFAHWPVSPEILKPSIPAPLELDTRDGRAWLGVVAFRLSKIRLHGLPEIGLVSHFNEINLRTYVTLGGKPGVLFLSMDADNPLAISIARPWFRLPYTPARISFARTRAGYAIDSVRTGGGPEAAFKATYRREHGSGVRDFGHPEGTRISDFGLGTRDWGSGIGDLGSGLDRWLTERYCYYSPTPRATYRCEILHPPWPLQNACARIERNTLASAIGIDQEPCEPILHYSHRITAKIWGLERISTRTPGRLRTLCRGGRA